MNEKYICPSCRMQIHLESLDDVDPVCPFCDAAVSVGTGSDDAEVSSSASLQDTIDFEYDAASGERRSFELKEGMNLGGFSLMRLLGQGGMGEVWQARQISMDRIVALKVMYPHFSSNTSFLYRFNKEITLLGNLDHPTILTAHDAGEDKGVHYLAMKYIEGRSLSEVLKDTETISEQQALLIIRDIAEALQYAWNEIELLHRDIKPGNIIIDNSGKPYVTDLGISKKSGDDNSLTIAGAPIGTPFYMSPEQARGDADIDFRSDMYSLGITLYHMLTGVVPFDGETTAQVISQHIAADFPVPDEKDASVSSQCVELLKIMMNKDKAERHNSWADLIADIELVGKQHFPQRCLHQKFPFKKVACGLAAAACAAGMLTLGTFYNTGKTHNVSSSSSQEDEFAEIPAENIFKPQVDSDSSSHLAQASPASKRSILASAASATPPQRQQADMPDEDSVADVSLVQSKIGKSSPLLLDMLKRKKIRVAVFPFANQTSEPGFDGLASSCSEAIMTPLTKLDTITLVERSQVDQVVKEIDFNQSKYVDPRYAVKLGELLGVDLSIMGSLQQFGSQIRISLRIVSSETGEVLDAGYVGGFVDDLFTLQDKAGEMIAAKLK